MCQEFLEDETFGFTDIWSEEGRGYLSSLVWSGAAPGESMKALREDDAVCTESETRTTMLRGCKHSDLMEGIILDICSEFKNENRHAQIYIARIRIIKFNVVFVATTGMLILTFL